MSVFVSITRRLGITVFALGLAGAVLPPAQAREVNIAPGIPYVDVQIGNRTIRIERIQNTRNRLKNSYAKTSRACPPFCVQPIEAAPGVKTVGELEVLQFLKNKAAKNEGVLVDAGIPARYKKLTIPGAVNIPFMLFTPDNPYRDRILLVLGAKKLEDGTWDFGGAKELLLFCNAPWGPASPKAIRNLIRAGYPPEKLYWYRGGMQEWLHFGLTYVSFGGRQ